MRLWRFATGLTLLPASLALVLAAGLAPLPAAGAPISEPPFHRCVNLGGTFEVPPEATWGHKTEVADLANIHQAGFDAVRLPVGWSLRARLEPPYAIDPAFFHQVDEVVDAATAKGLTVILDFHGYEKQFSADPDAHEARFIALWKEIGEHYAARPPSVIFGLLNEPSKKLDSKRLQSLYPTVLQAIRASNPTRLVVLGGPGWNGLRGGLDVLTVPAGDAHLVADLHDYDPFAFTHYKAPWIENPPSLPRGYGSAQDVKDLTTRMQMVVALRSKLGVPVIVGEFGAIANNTLDDRTSFLRAKREFYEAAGLGWCVWSFADGSFSTFDLKTQHWIKPLLEALVPNSPALAQ